MATVVLGGLVGLVLLALLGVWLLVNPNDYKPRIAAIVKQSTGRDLALDGDIKLSVFPWIALELGPASLGNPAGFPAEPFIAFKHASVRVKLLPLLAKRLEVGRIELDGFDVKMLKNSEGNGNWEGFGKSASPTPEAGVAPAQGPLPQIEGIKITNARVRYEKVLIENFSLETGTPHSGVVPITMHVDASRGVADEKATLDLRLDASADLPSERFRIVALDLRVVATLAGNATPVPVSVSAPLLDLDLKAQTLDLPAFSVNAAGAAITGSAHGTSIADALELHGGVKLAPLVVRTYLPRLGLPLPKTRDPKALSSLAAAGDYAYGKGTALVDHLDVTLDDTHVKGSAAVTLARQAVNFDLAVDALDADRYLGPPDPPGVPPAPIPRAAAERSNPLAASGTLTVGVVHLAPLELEKVVVTLATKDKVMHIFPLKARVYGGQYSGDITMDNRTALAGLSFDEHLTGIDVGRLVAAESKKLRVTGRGDVNIKGTAKGSGSDAILKTLNGHFDLNVADGAVEGLDLGYALAQAEAMIGKHELSNAPNTKRTKFDALKMSATIADGVASTKDLIVSSAVLKVTGQGNANLPANTLDFALVADTLTTAGHTSLLIPVKVTGPMMDPTVRPDLAALAKGQIKQKVQDVLEDKLKDLFH